MARQAKVVVIGEGEGGGQLQTALIEKLTYEKRNAKASATKPPRSSIHLLQARADGLQRTAFRNRNLQSISLGDGYQILAGNGALSNCKQGEKRELVNKESRD